VPQYAGFSLLYVEGNENMKIEYQENRKEYGMILTEIHIYISLSMLANVVLYKV
jgi:hypothetical protein